MSRILVVDDDKNFLLSLADGLSSYNKEFKVFTAENGKAAVELLKTHEISIMITDLKMPEMDGFELLAFMVSRYPHIPVIVMTAFATVEMENQVMNMGTFVFLEKPLDFHVLVEKIQEGMEASSHYFTKVVSFSSFLHMIEMDKKTCTISVRSRGRMGYLYFMRGTLIDAETEHSRGAKAVYVILAWEDPEIDVENRCRQDSEKTVVPLNYIIREEQWKFKKAHLEAVKDKKNNSVPGVLNQDGANNQYIDKDNLKETKMDIAKLNQAVEVLKEDMGDALVGVSIVSRVTGQIIIDHQAHPKAGALFNQLTRFLRKVLQECSMPPLGRYYLVDLEGDQTIIAIPLRDYECGIRLDLRKVTLGLFLNVTLPKLLDSFKEAMVG